MSVEDSQRNAVLLALKMEKGVHELKNADSLQKLEEARRWILPCSLLKEMQPC